MSGDHVDLKFGNGVRITASTLEPVQDADKIYEIREGDSVIFAGRYLIVAEMAEMEPPPPHNGTPAFRMLNSLKIVDVVDEGASRPNKREQNLANSKTVLTPV